MKDQTVLLAGSLSALPTIYYPATEHYLTLAGTHFLSHLKYLFVSISGLISSLISWD